VTRVLVVDDHKLIFDGLVHDLGDRYELVHAPTTNVARRLVAEGSFHAAIVDVSLHGETGFEMAEFCVDAGLHTVFLTMHAQPLYVRRARQLGAVGYFLKDDDLSGLPAALDGGQGFVTSPAVALDGGAEHQPSTYDLLTPREQQVFRLLAEGRGYKEIAYHLSISSKTVNVHRENLMRKMNLESQTQLVKAALRLGVVTL
jgi:DNA-binding NarL/FixJ family response regulator